MNILENKTITSIELASDRKAIKFNLHEHDPVIVKTDGDCCSSSWIEHVETPAMGFPAKVLKVEDIDFSDKDYESEEYEHLQFYGCKITTDKGEIVIDYRNASNGYYGGNLCWPSEDKDVYFYGGVWGQNISSEEWKQLSDFQDFKRVDLE